MRRRYSKNNRNLLFTDPDKIFKVGLYADDVIGFVSRWVEGTSMELLNQRIEENVIKYIGADWDIYFGIFLLTILFFVISFRRQ